MTEYLHKHLRSSGRSQLLDEMEKWREIGGQELIKRRDLLDKIDNIIKEKTGHLPSSDMSTLGPKVWFSNTIMSGLFNATSKPFKYHQEDQEPGGLFSIKYGAYCIGLAADKKEAEHLQEIHRQMIGEIENDFGDLVKEIEGT